MRHWMWIALTAACGQMYQAPGSQAAPGPAPAPSSAEPLPSPAGPPPPSAAPSRPDQAGPPPGPAWEDRAAAPAQAQAPEDPYGEVQAERADRGAPRPSSEQAAWLEAHNRARARHCARPLTWSPKLAQIAQRWASSLRDRGCQFGHSGGKFGENLAAGTSGTLDPGSVVKMWYDEIAQYHFPDGGFSMETGHFTQVVWRGTAAVGCGRASCKGMDIFVCEYDPPGNWEGQYRQNVLPTGCRER